MDHVEPIFTGLKSGLKTLRVNEPIRNINWVSNSLCTEAEFLDIAEKLKPHVERRMKIEPFPWLRDYYIDMNKLYTELILEKIENEVLGVSRRTLKDYKEMFESDDRDKIGLDEHGLGKNEDVLKVIRNEKNC